MINKLLPKLKKELEETFKDNLIGIVLYGSYAKNTQTKNSDLDILLVFKKLPKTRLERVFLLEETLNKLENEFKISINPLIKQKNELKLNFLTADIFEYAKIISDSNNIISKFSKKIKKEYEKGFIQKISSEDHYRLYVKNV